MDITKTLFTIIFATAIMGLLAIIALSLKNHIRTFKALLFAIWAIPFVIVGSTKPPQGWIIRWDEGLYDNGSTVTNGTLYARWTFTGILATDIVHAMFKPSGSQDYVEIARTTAGELSLTANVGEGAEHGEYFIFSEYVPPTPVHTNGVYKVNGIIKNENEKFIPSLLGVEENGNRIKP